MKRLLLIFLSTLLLSSCYREKQLKYYNSIIENADEFKYYRLVNDTFSLTKEITSFKEVKNMITIFKRHITPEPKRKFEPDYRIEICKRDSVIGVLLISGKHEKPFVNFQSKNFEFSFRLTYGIGMSL